ncbi:MAG: glycosyltransferase [Sandaracinus sp.]|nr:glycosyltransferase [Sandaracinus sp.]
MRDTPDVSVLLPYRNAARTIEAALTSVLADDSASIEVLAVDDGSTDDGPARVAALADSRVRVSSSRGRGLVAALELARRHARAPYLARMDADDLTLRGRFGRQRDALNRRPELGAIGTEVEVFADEGAPGEGMARYVAWMNGLTSPADHRRELFVESPLCHPSTMLRASAVEAVGGYRDGDFPEDYELWLRLDAAGHALAKIPEVFVRWRQHAGQTTFADPRYRPEAFRALKARYLAPKLHRRVRPLAVWGAGPVGRRTLRALEPHGVRAARFVDIDPKKIGRIARGIPILDPSGADEAHFVIVAVGARGARELVREELVSRGRVEGMDFVCVA